MNLLEHHIKSVISVKPYTAEWTKEHPHTFLKITVVANCYGQEQEYNLIRTAEEWGQIEKQGYFMG